MLVYPDLKQDQLFSMIREIKKQNNNTLKNLSLNQILDKVSELKGKVIFTFKREPIPHQEAVEIYLTKKPFNTIVI